MSIVLHDRKGYVCDLGSAAACWRFSKWLSKRDRSEIACDFVRDGQTLHPRTLANEIVQLLKDAPPDAHTVELARAYVRGLRRARGYAMLTQ